MSSIPAPSRLPTRIPSTATTKVSSLPRSASDSSYVATLGASKGRGSTSTTASVLPRSASTKSLTAANGPSSSTAQSTAPRSFKSRFSFGGGYAASKKKASAAKAADPPQPEPMVPAERSSASIPSVYLEEPSNVVTPWEADPPPPSPTGPTSSPQGRPKSIGGSSIGRKSGVFSFGRPKSLAEQPIPLVAPRFQKQVSRPSIEGAFSEHINVRTPPARVASVRNASIASLRAPNDHPDDRSYSTSPAHSRHVQSPTLESRPTTRNSTRNSLRSPTGETELRIASPTKRDSSLRAAETSPVPLSPIHPSIKRTTGAEVDAWVNAEQSINTPVLRSPLSATAPFLEPNEDLAGQGSRSRRESTTSSLIKATSAGSITKDLAVPHKDDLAYRRHSISPVFDTSTNGTTPQDPSNLSPNPEDLRGTRTNSRQSRARGSSPLPQDVAEIRAKGSSSSSGELVTKPVNIPSVFQQGSDFAPRPASYSSNESPVLAQNGFGQRIRTDSQATAIAPTPPEVNRVAPPQSQNDTLGESKKTSTIRDSGSRRGSASDSSLSGGSSLRRSLSAIDAARKNPAAAMRNVESGSPVLVRHDVRFSEGAESRIGLGSQRGSGLAHESKVDTLSPSDIQKQGRDDRSGASPILEERSLESDKSGRSHTSGLASPLDDLVHQLGGRRHSDTSSAGRPTSVGFTSLGSNVPLTENVIADTSPLLAASSPPTSLRPVSASEDDTRFSDDAASVVDPDGPLTLDQMEREISRMEAELALSGSKRFSTLGVHVASTPPRSRRNKSLELANALGNSTNPYDLINSSTHSFPSSSNLTSADLERNSSQSSSIITNEITPRTARRWSIVEVERAYERMKRILASASSKPLTAMSDAGTLNGSEMGDVAVEDAFETALARARAYDTPARGILDEPDEDAHELLVTPEAIQETIPSTQTTPTSRSHGLRDLKLSTSAGRSLRDSPRPSLSNRRSLQVDDPSSATDSSDAAVNRRHTIHGIASEDSDASDVFGIGNSAKADVPSLQRRGSETSADHRTLDKRGNAESAKSLTGASETGSEEAGWATPLSSFSTVLSKFGRSPRNAAGGSTRVSTSPASNVLSRRSVDDISVRSASAKSMDTTPRRRSLLLSSSDRTAIVDGQTANGTWFPATPGRTQHRRPISQASTVDVHDRESTNDTNRTLVENDELTMANVRSMDKLELFFKYTAVKAEADKAVLERNALIDALAETRSTLVDIRAQRDELLEELKKEKQENGLNAAGPTSNGHSHSAVDDLTKSRATWEARALDTAEELERSREELFVLRQELVESRSREDQLERESLNLSAKVAAMEATRVTLQAGASSIARRSSNPTSPRTGASPRLNGSPSIPSMPIRPPRRVSTEEVQRLSPPKSAGSPGPSPNKRFSRSSVPFAELPGSPPSTPAAKLAHAYRQRRGSAGSSGSSEGLVDATVTMRGNQGSSPLMEQRAAFGPKSSYGSLAASPLKTRSLSGADQSAALAALGINGESASQTLPNARTGNLRSRLPFLGSPKNRQEKRILSKSSNASSATASDYGGDHLPPNHREKVWDPKASLGSSTGSVGVARLRDDDAQFLKDLLQEE